MSLASVDVSLTLRENWGMTEICEGEIENRYTTVFIDLLPQVMKDLPPFPMPKQIKSKK